MGRTNEEMLNKGKSGLAMRAVMIFLSAGIMLSSCGGNAREAPPSVPAQTPESATAPEVAAQFGFPKTSPLPEDFFSLEPSNAAEVPVDIKEEKRIDPEVYLRFNDFYLAEAGYDEPAGIFLVLEGVIRNEGGEEFIINTGRSFYLEDLNGRRYVLSYDYSVPPRDDEEAPRMFAGAVGPGTERSGELPFDILDVPPDGVFFLYHVSVVTGKVTRWRVH